jgi:glycosyltransferase involved in cell wall biosynthesis
MDNRHRLMPAPLVTVGIPIYNAAPFLDMAIRSVVNQTFQDWELILLDDGSTDDSLAIARRWESNRIRVVSDGQNRGLATRLNQLSALAASELVARMDADDVMAPDRLARQVAFLAAHPGVMVVGALAWVIDTENRVVGVRGRAGLPQTVRDVAYHQPLIHPTVMFRREWSRFNPYYPYFPNRTQDAELWLRTWNPALFHVLDEPLLFYREMGVAYLSKYLAASAEARLIYRLYARPIGPWWAWRLGVQSRTKDLIYRFFNALGREDVLLRRRSRPLTEADRQRAETLLRQSLNGTS